MAAQTYQFIITGNCCGQFVQNVLHYRIDDAGFANRLLAAKGLIDGWLAASKQDAWLAMLPDDYLMKSLKARRVTNGGGPEFIDVSLDGDPGGFGSGAQMSGAGPVIIWFTDGGPRRTGKTFLAGIGIDKVDGGEIIATAVTAINSASADFRTTFSTVGGGAVTATQCIPRSNDPATRSLIVGSLVSKNVGQQRRRQLPV